MPATTFYPSLGTLIPVENIPDEVGFLRTGLQNIFSHLYFSDLQTSHSVNADAGFYSLKIRTYKRLALELPGANGLALILNPDFDPDSQVPTSTSLPISLSYDWKILKYVKDFNTRSFSFTAEQFFDLLLDITATSKNDLLTELVHSLIDDQDPIQKFVDDFNNNHSPATPLVKSNDPDEEIVIADLVNQLTSNGNNFDVFEIIFDDYISVTDQLGTSFDKLEIIFQRWLQIFSIENLKNILIPYVTATFNFNFGLEFPLSILRMVDANGQPILIPSGPNAGQETPALLTCSGGYFTYGSKTGFDFDFNYALSFLNYAEIKGTGLYFNIQNAKIDLSKKKNIPEAEADGRPDDFTGVYVQETDIYFPQFWNHDSSGSTAVIKGRGLIIGTGGFSGLLALESSQPGDKAIFRLGDPNNSEKNFQLSIDQFLIEFKQNSIIQSEVSGKLKIPGLKDANNQDADIDVKVHVGKGGDFRITATEQDGVQLLRIPDVLDLTLRSISVGREDDKWYIEASGSLLLTVVIPHVESDFFKQAIDIKKLRIYQDGSIEFVGGSIKLPTHIHINIGPVSLSMESMSFNPHEGTYQGIKRHYLCIGFDGNLNVGGGSVNVSGNGVEFHFTIDNNPGKPFHSYLRISGIGIDIKIPGNASKEEADVYIAGYLAMQHGVDANGNELQSGPEYQGSVTVDINKLKLHAKASMRMKPKVPAYIVDVELDIPTPIPLGPTGLGIYGFRGLIGLHFVASKPYIGIAEDDLWFEYLKKKVPPTNKQGIYVEKFDPARKGFSLGIGASIATMGDDGWAFSSKVFVMISIPEMLLIEGQANVLHKRLGISSDQDPPFYAFLILDKHSVQAGIGVNYKIPDGGEILSLRGEMQMAFFFSNSTAWFINIGKDLPEDKRIQSRLFTLFNAYSYLMINNKGIRAGAGAKFEFKKKYGPVKVGLYAFIDTKGFISFKPIQIGGSIVLGGGVYIKIGRFGIEIHVTAGLSAEAPIPFVIAGFIKIKVKLGPFKIKIQLEFTWIFNRDLNTAEVRVLDPADFLALPAGSAEQYPFKAINMLSSEAFKLKWLGESLSGINPETDNSWNNFVIPMDSFIDIEFKRPVKPYKTRYGGGVNPLPQFTEYVAPQKARMPQVKHNFSVENIEIKIWNKNTHQWDAQNYNPWEALTRAFQNAGLTVNTSTYDFGYWQYNNVPGKYTSLRLLSQSPFAVSNGVPPESFGILSQQILCQGAFETKTCQYWNEKDPATIYPADEIILDRNLLLKFTEFDGSIGSFPNPFGIARSLKVKESNSVEIYLKEPMPFVALSLTSLAGVTISYYQKQFTGGDTISGLPDYDYVIVNEQEYSWPELQREIIYEDQNSPVSKIVIETKPCEGVDIEQMFMDYWADVYNWWMAGNDSLEDWQQQQIQLWLEIYGATPGNPGAIALNNLCQEWNDLLESNTLTQGETNVVTNWIGSYCGSTDYEGVFSELCSIWSDPEITPSYPVLYSYIFLWQEKYCQGGLPGLAEFDLCSTYVHEVCWMTEQQWEYNVLLQQNNQSVINTGINSLSQAINQALPPVWRPDSSYALVITIKDAVSAGGNSAENYQRQFAVGYRTTGTLGFFHQTQQDYLDLLNYQDPVTGNHINKADQYKLANLRHYIDYQRSYPNADGNILGAKPLYYKSPKLGIFFTKPYVYEFFTKWDEYRGNPAKEYQLLSVIMDPVDKPDAPPAIPAEVISWQLRIGQQAIPVDALEIETISNILTQGNPNCTGITNILVPPTVNAEIQRNYDLKPQKLYKAIFKAIEVNISGNLESIVHSYGFQTSRYGDFAEHIQSYTRTIADPDTGVVSTSNAFFPLVIEKNTAALSALNTKLQQIISNTLPATDPLIRDYASVYDRIITGVLEMQALQASTDTEFNIIKLKNTDTNAVNIAGILIKSPEPFNDPKLPSVNMAGTITVTDQSNNNNQFIWVFAKDNSSIFITNDALSLPLHSLNIAFRRVKFNGVSYATYETINVPIDLASI